MGRGGLLSGRSKELLIHHRTRSRPPYKTASFSLCQVKSCADSMCCALNDTYTVSLCTDKRPLSSVIEKKVTPFDPPGQAVNPPPCFSGRDRERNLNKQRPDEWRQIDFYPEATRKVEKTKIYQTFLLSLALFLKEREIDPYIRTLPSSEYTGWPTSSVSC